MFIFLYSSPQGKIHYVINLLPVFWLVAGKFFLQYKNNIRDDILFNYSVLQQKKLWFFFVSNFHLPKSLFLQPCCSFTSALLFHALFFVLVKLPHPISSAELLCCSVYGRMKIIANWFDFWIFVKSHKCLYVKPVPLLLE